MVVVATIFQILLSVYLSSAQDGMQLEEIPTVIDAYSRSPLLCIRDSECPVGCECRGSRIACRDVTKFPNLPSCVTHFTLDGGCFKGKGNEKCLRRLEPGSFSIMKKLVELKILNTKIEILPKGIFQGMVHLRLLQLHGNRLIFSNKYSQFADLINLKTLSLSDNHITFISPYLFYGLRSLEVLDLSNNFIRCIPAIMYNQLPSLKTIVLTHNHLEHFLSGTAKSARNLEIVYLQNNQLRSLSTNVFDGLVSLKEVYLEQNNLECSCDMYKLILNLMDMNVFVEGNCQFQWKNRKSQQYHLTTIPRHIVCPDLDECRQWVVPFSDYQFRDEQYTIPISK